MAIPRTLGPVIQARAQQLRRQAMVALSELTGATTADGSYPRLVDIVRPEPSGPANSAAGVATVWTEVPGLTNLVGHVRYFGRWVDVETGVGVELRDNQRVVMVADIPAGGAGAAGDLLLSDNLRFEDQTYGVADWKLLQVRVRKPDGLAWALCEWAREEDVG